VSRIWHRGIQALDAQLPAAAPVQGSDTADDVESRPLVELLLRALDTAVTQESELAEGYASC